MYYFHFQLNFHIYILVLSIWLLIEFFFFVYLKYFLLPSIQPIKKGQAPLFKDPVELIRSIYSLLESVQSYSFVKFCKGFFLGCDIGDIYTGNYDSFLAWTIYVRHFQDLNDNEKKIIHQLRLEAVNKFQITMKEGYNSSVEHSKFNLENITFIHKPLLLYGLLNIFELYSNLFVLYRDDFREFYNSNGMKYWYRVRDKKLDNSNNNNSNNNNNNNEYPILIIHGICSGWAYYSTLIKILGSNRSVILLDYSCIRINWVSLHVPDPTELNNSVLEILNKHNIEKISLIGHSWGTFLCGWIIRMNPDIVSHLTLIDPIALTVVLPETSYKILYEPPKNWSDYLLYYFVRKDISIANTLHRNFAWYNVALFLHDMPRHIPTVIGLAGVDELICSDVIIELLRNQHYKSKNIKLLFWPSLAHGQAIITKSSLLEVKMSLEEK